MAYGLKVYDASGNTILDVTDKISRLVYTHDAIITESDSIYLSAINGHSTVEFALVLGATGYNPHNVYRTGDTIYWVPDSYYPYASRILVFMYD